MSTLSREFKFRDDLRKLDRRKMALEQTLTQSPGGFKSHPEMPASSSNFTGPTADWTFP
jgi:hypothetical protein